MNPLALTKRRSASKANCDGCGSPKVSRRRVDASGDLNRKLCPTSFNGWNHLVKAFLKFCGVLGFALLSVGACAERGAGLRWNISPQQLRSEFDKVALVGEDPRLGVYERTRGNGDIYYLAIVKIEGEKAFVSYGTSIPQPPLELARTKASSLLLKSSGTGTGPVRNGDTLSSWAEGTASSVPAPYQEKACFCTGFAAHNPQSEGSEPSRCHARRLRRWVCGMTRLGQLRLSD